MEYLPKHDVKLMVTPVAFMTGANANPSRDSFPLKKTDGSDAVQVTRDSAFPYQLSDFITAAWGGSGSHWSPWLLLPLLCICQGREKPEVGSTGSQAASLFPAEERLKWAVGVTRIMALVQVSWVLTAIGNTHQGLPHQGFFLPHPYTGSQQAVRMVVQDSWLFWGFEVPSCSLAF